MDCCGAGVVDFGALFTFNWIVYTLASRSELSSSAVLVL